MTVTVNPAVDISTSVGKRAPFSKGGESIVGELHSTLANITLGLIILHILGDGVVIFPRA